MCVCVCVRRGFAQVHKFIFDLKKTHIHTHVHSISFYPSHWHTVQHEQQVKRRQDKTQAMSQKARQDNKSGCFITLSALLCAPADTWVYRTGTPCTQRELSRWCPSHTGSSDWKHNSHHCVKAWMHTHLVTPPMYTHTTHPHTPHVYIYPCTHTCSQAHRTHTVSHLACIPHTHTHTHTSHFLCIPHTSHLTCIPHTHITPYMHTTHTHHTSCIPHTHITPHMHITHTHHTLHAYHTHITPYKKLHAYHTHITPYMHTTHTHHTLHAYHTHITPHAYHTHTHHMHTTHTLHLTCIPHTHITCIPHTSHASNTQT